MTKPDNRPATGTIIAPGSHAYRVLEYREPFLPGAYLYEMILERLTCQDKGEHYGIEVKSRYAFWRALDEHYAVCNCCNELPPCSGVRAARAVENRRNSGFTTGLWAMTRSLSS